MKTPDLITKIIGYKLFRMFNFPKIMPINLTISITNKCNSKCKTCKIWKLKRTVGELNVDEINKITKSIGDIYWITLSGGEPFLRKDLDKICEIIYKNNKPSILNIPTNGLLPKIIEEKTKKILKKIPNSTILIINISFDGLKNKQDEVRGIKNAWKKAILTYYLLSKIKKEHKNLKIGIHSVISKYNIKEILNTYKWINESLKPDSYVTEIAEHRVELNNINDKIVPNLKDYEKVIKTLISKSKTKKGLLKIQTLFREEYYKNVIKTLKQKKQIIPCYASYVSCQISATGEIWPCCIKAKCMGNLRDFNYNFKKIWFSKKADQIRKGIKKGKCYCPLANASYTNLLMDTKTLLKIFKNFLIR